MLVLVCLSLVASGKALLYLVQAVIVVSFMASYWAAKAAFRTYSHDRLATELGAAVVAVQTLILSQGGMEITLTIPLVLALCWYRLRPRFSWSLNTAIIYGLLAAAVVLSRLDAMLFVAPLFVLECIFRGPSPVTDSLIRFTSLVSGCLPIGIYELVNRHFFHTWTPISAQAKQLRAHYVPSLGPLISILHSLSISLLITCPAVLAIAITVLTGIFRGGGRLQKEHRPIVLSLLLFPLLQQLVLSSRSDWPLWSWYAYPFVLATAGALLVGFSRGAADRLLCPPRIRRFMGLLGGVMIMLFAVCDIHQTTVVRLRRDSCYWFAQDLVAFSATHKGVYAMGDSAGTTAYLIQQPLVQLEGLVMDEAFLDNIRRQRDLNQVLANYKVRYYVIPSPRLVEGCYQAVEPAEAGPDSPKMRGKFCIAPTGSFDAGGFPLVVLDLQTH
jgi:hypothetical protein